MLMSTTFSKHYLLISAYHYFSVDHDLFCTCGNICYLLVNKICMSIFELK